MMQFPTFAATAKRECLLLANRIFPPRHLPIPALAPLFALLVLLWSGAALADTHYVWTDSPSPAAPYTNWDTAARIIQDAVVTAQPGDVVLVTNGVYDTGGRAVYGYMTNRVAIDRAISVQSVNGPEVTCIMGAPASGTITNNGDGAIRCAYVGTNAVLSGFTLTNGHTRKFTAVWECSGGGVWCEVSGIVTNCILTGNSADNFGGGSFCGMLDNCTLTGNLARYGGGACSNILNNCTLSGNSASGGGGTYYGRLNTCTLTNNRSSYFDGGGSYCAILNNCTLISKLDGQFGKAVGWRIVRRYAEQLHSNRQLGSAEWRGIVRRHVE